MDIREILLAQGMTSEQADNVLASMKEHKIYTTTHENIDVRYEKLKAKHDDLNAQITNANATIEELKKSNTDNESLQAALDKYKTDYEALQQESEAKVRNMTIDTQIKALMKEYKVKDKYDELLMSKIDKTALQLDDKGEVVGLADIFTGLKTDYADLFSVDKFYGTKPNANGGSVTEFSAMEESIKNSIFKK